MTNLSSSDEVAQHIAACLRREAFTLLDIGCSGGIQPAWRIFGERLKAVGFDPNIEEVERLRAAERLSGVSYEAGFVGVPNGHHLALDLAGRSFVARTPWNRLSVARTLAVREEFLKRADNKALTNINAWPRTRLASPEPIFLPDYVARHGFDDLDFVKIDVDGADFVILQSLFECAIGRTILGLMLEVNFHGSDDPRDNTFHNIDRFMRRMGFDLFDLSIRRYSSSALPYPYEYDLPAQTLGGRPFQGDAFYVRDLGVPEMADHAAGLSAEKIAKVAAIFAIGGLHDQAAETLTHFAARLAEVMEVEPVLELLAGQVQKGQVSPLSYRDYLAAFERDDALFYPYRRGGRAAVPPMGPSSAGGAGGNPGMRKRRKKSLLKRVKKWLTR